MSFFDRFKPKSDAAADLADRYAAASSQRAALAAEIAAMEARRGDVLVDAVAVEAEAFEVALAEKRHQLGAVEAIAATLAERKAAAERSERKRALEARIAAAEAEASAVAAELGHLPEIVAPLLALLRREAAVCRAIAPLVADVAAAARDGVAIEGQQYVVAPRRRHRPAVIYSHPGSDMLAPDVRLPAANGAPPLIWPPAC